jgi:hypothetical protein
MSDIEDCVCKKIQDRAALGLTKYKVKLADANLSEREILKHAQEEAMDLANYLEFRIQQIDKEELCKPPSRKYYFDPTKHT